METSWDGEIQAKTRRFLLQDVGSPRVTCRMTSSRATSPSQPDQEKFWVVLGFSHMIDNTSMVPCCSPAISTSCWFYLQGASRIWLFLVAMAPPVWVIITFVHQPPIQALASTLVPYSQRNTFYFYFLINWVKFTGCSNSTPRYLENIYILDIYLYIDI